MDSEKPTLKPIPPQFLNCSMCKKTFLSTMQLNSKFYKSCDECRFKSRKQWAKYTSDYKQLIINLK
jgi:hypothetical protein